jgi:ribonucleoside-diphosphate reductase alpha chain
VKFATSIIDFIFRALGVEYLHRYDLAHIKPDASSTPLDAAQHLGTPPEPPSLRQLPAVTSATAHDSRPPAAGPHGEEPLPHTREATARSAAMSETLGDGVSPLDAQLDTMMGDAPVCDVCGHITVRNGACYKCLNCGNSMGCS